MIRATTAALTRNATLALILGLACLTASLGRADGAHVVDLRNDARLAKHVRLNHPRIAISSVAEELSAETGVRLTVARQIADDQVSCLLSGRAASEVLRGISSVMNYVITDDGSGGYLLDLHPAVAEVVTRLRRELEAIERERQRRGLDAILDGIVRALEGGPAAGGDGEARYARGRVPGLLQVLQGLSGDQLNAVAGGAAQPFGLISAGASAHMRGRVYFQQPLSSFPSAVQQEIRNTFEASPELWQQFQAQADPLVGVAAHQGCLGLCLQVGDRIYNAPTAPFGGEEARAVDAQAGAHRSRALQGVDRLQRAEPPWRDPLSQDLLPGSYRRWNVAPFVLRVQPRLHTNRAHHVLSELARQGNLSLIADSFSASTFVAQALGLADDPTHGNAAAWARRVARAFRRVYRCENGLLLLRSRQYVWDRYTEPPGQIVAELVQAKQQNGRLELREYALATKMLHRDQVRTLGLIQTQDSVTFWREAMTLERQRRLLEFVGAVPQVINDGSEKGSVMLAEVPKSHRWLFHQLLWSGEALSAPKDYPVGPVISWRVQSDEVWVEFVDSSSGIRRAHRIPLGLKNRIRATGQ